MAKEKALTRKSYAENGTLPQHLSSKTLLTPSLFVQKKNELANFFWGATDSFDQSSITKFVHGTVIQCHVWSTHYGEMWFTYWLVSCLESWLWSPCTIAFVSKICQIIIILEDVGFQMIEIKKLENLNGIKKPTATESWPNKTATEILIAWRMNVLIN